jgi:hypothetical protein
MGELVMPQGTAGLMGAQLDLVKRWIEAGAPGPGEGVGGDAGVVGAGDAGSASDAGVVGAGDAAASDAGP